MVLVDVIIRQPDGAHIMSLAAAAAATVDDVKHACQRVQPLPRSKFLLELQLPDWQWVHVDKASTLGGCLASWPGTASDGRLAMRLLPK